MEEKERYEWNSVYDSAVRDNKNDDIINAIERLNEQDKRIKELEEQENFFFDYRDRCQLEEYQRWADNEITKLNKENQQLKQQLAESEKERELDNSFWKQKCDSLQKQLHDLSN